MYRQGKMTNIVIVRFVNRDVRNEIFYKRSKIVDAKIRISEHLTRRNFKLLKDAKELLGDKYAWSSQTKLFGLVGNTKRRISSNDDLKKLHEMKLAFDEVNLPATRVDIEPDVASTVDTTQTAAPEAASTTDTVTNINNNIANNSTNRFNTIFESWPNLTEADIITAINNFNNKRNSTSGKYFNTRGRGNWQGRRGRGAPPNRGRYNGHHY